jgi:hypothetical protein
VKLETWRQTFRRKSYRFTTLNDITLNKTVNFTLTRKITSNVTCDNVSYCSNHSFTVGLETKQLPPSVAAGPEPWNFLTLISITSLSATHKSEWSKHFVITWHDDLHSHPRLDTLEVSVLTHPALASGPITPAASCLSLLPPGQVILRKGLNLIEDFLMTCVFMCLYFGHEIGVIRTFSFSRNSPYTYHRQC